MLTASFPLKTLRSANCLAAADATDDLSRALRLPQSRSRATWSSRMRPQENPSVLSPSITK